jgi:hypothetical protein
VTGAAFVANLAWPGTAIALGLVAAQVIGFGLVLEWVVTWKAFGLTAGRAAIATLVMNAFSALVGVPLAYTLGGVVGGEPLGALGYLLVASILSAAIEAATLARWFGVPATGRSFAWLAGVNVASCVVVTLAFVLSR